MAALLVLGLSASLPSLSNGFTYDDIPIVRDNARIHEIASPLTYLGQSYWTPGFGNFLYRPVTIQLFALEWAAGGGSPFMFHAVNLALYALVTLAVFGLARLLLPFGAAFAAAALFAVHPVHVEAVANVVGQAELVCALAALGAVMLYLRTRQSGDWTTGTRMSLAGLAVVAALAKEQGFMLPGLLLMAEVTVVRRREAWQPRARAVLEALAPMMVILGTIFIARGLVLGGLGGGAPAMGLQHLWPAHLRAEYSPPEFAASVAFGGKELFGTVMALCGVGVWFAARRAQPVIAFGLGWFVVAILPVSNLVFTTGVIIAERTLFLPSVGVVLAIAALGAAMLTRWPTLVIRRAVLVVLAVTVVLGVGRSRSRSRVWHDNLILFSQSIADAPRGYRAYRDFGIALGEEGRLPEAEAVLRRAAALYDRDARVFEELSHAIRRQRTCLDAVPFMQQALAVDSSLTLSRSRLYYCQLKSGQILAARETAARGEALGLPEFAPMRVKADSMLSTAQSPPLPPPPRGPHN
jgi:hypothetical protein